MTKIAATLALLLWLAAEGRAQSDVDAFDPGANNTVRALAVQPDGKIIVGGFFTTLGGGGTGTTTRNFIGRVNSDGTLDTIFNPGANSTVFAVALQADGRIVVGGAFSTLGGGGTGTTTRNFIGRLNADGTLDTSFDPGADNLVRTLAVQADGRILVGGDFSTLGGGGTGTTTRNHIGRLNADGKLDTSFDPGANGSVITLVEQADGKILAGGDFTTLGGGGTGTTSRNKIGRINPDGTLDASFDPGANGAVETLAVQADGKIVVGGAFTTLGGGGLGTTTRLRIGRLNPDGTLDTSFDPGANSDVFTLAAQTDGKILLGGSFTALGGGFGTTTRNFIGRLEVPPPPVITSPLTATATVGEPFVYQFEATEATSLAVTNPPEGLMFDSLLSAIIGTPGVAGTTRVVLSATNDGGTTTAILNLTVQSPPVSGQVFISGTSATVRTGQPFTFQVITSGFTAAARLSATGLPAGLSVDPVTGIISGTATTDGSSEVVLTATEGNLTATATLELTFSSDLALPVITSPNEVTLVTSQPFTYQIVAPSSDTSDPITYTEIGTLPSGLSFNPVTGVISGIFKALLTLQPDPLLSGGVVTNVQLFATNSHGTTTIPLTFFLAPTGALEIATRLNVGIGDNALFGGFILTGNAPKKVIIRALGPELIAHGITDALADPVLELHFPDGSIVTNDDWKATQEAEIIATGIPPTNDKESAILAYLDSSTTGVPYTALVKGKNGTTGVALVEIYDLGTASFDISSQAQLANISTRGLGQTADDVLIGGLILGGNTSTVLLRAIGPSLAGQNITNPLLDPTLELKDVNGTTIDYNDDWGNAANKQNIIDTGAAPTDSHESAILRDLAAGDYTAIVRGKNNTIGVAVVEAYFLP